MSVPMIRGAGGGGKGGGKGGVTGATVQPDSLASRAYALVMDLICEGEIEGLVGGMQGVYLDGTQLQNPNGSMNFSGVSFAFVTGTQNQDWIPGFGEVDNTLAVGLEVRQAEVLVRTITNTEVDAVRIIVTIPQLTYTNLSNGDVSGTTVQLRISVDNNGGGYVQRVYDTISGKASSQFQKQYLINLPQPGPWNIQVTRITQDNDNTPNIVDRFLWDSYTEVIFAKLTYPNSVIAALQIDSAQFQAIPQRLYRCKLLRIAIPSNYDPVALTYSGAWDGTFKIAWSNNPAWCFYDLLTNDRYGLGQFVTPTQVDKWALYTIAQYCDQLVPDGFGGMEPRFTCNVYIAARQAAFKVIQDLASVFRGMPFWSTGTVTAVQDAPAYPAALFTNANVIGGDFTYTGSSLKSRHTIALVTWNNMEDLGSKYVEYVGNDALIQQYGAILTEVTAFGCTSRGQAHRVGQWLLYSEQYEGETVSFKVGLDAAPVRPGDIIKISDSVRAGQRMGGRISAATATTVTLDSQLVDGNGNAINVVGGTLNVVTMDNVVSTPVVQSVTFDANNIPTLTVSPAMNVSSLLPANPAVWAIDIPTLATQQFRVIQLTESEPGQMTLTALAYNASKYNAIEDGTALTVQSITDLTQPPIQPSTILVQESLYSFQSTIFSQAEISWDNVAGAIAYQVGYRKDNGQWVYITGVPSNAYTINKADPGSYDIRVWSIGPQQRLGLAYAEVVTTLYGKMLPPSNVVGLTYGFDASLGLILSWKAAPDIDIAAYEIRLGTPWGAAQFLARTNSTEYIVGTDYAVDANVFLVEALDTQGNYSTDAASVTVTIPAAAPLALEGSFVGGNVVLTWNTVTGPLNIDHYEVRLDTNFKNRTNLIGTVKGTAYTLKALFANSQIFYVGAIDIGGNVVSSGSTTLTIVLPTIGGITTQVVDNNVLLRWTGTPGTLPIDHYILTTGGAQSAGGTLVGTTSGVFASFFETVAGSYTYFVQAVDVAGNLGPAFSVTATVSQPPDYVLHYNLDSTFSGTLTNAVLTNGVMTMPVDTTTTFEAHFTNNGWGAPQDQINAGDTLFIEPSPGNASYVEEIDYGAQLPASSIQITPTIAMTIGSPVPSYQIQTSPDGTTWTTYSGLTCYATAFRYMKFTITVTGGPTDLIAYQGINYKYQVKKQTDNGSVTCNATDANGTPVTFNTAFIDVQSIQVTAGGTTNVTAIYAFDGAPDPTGFTIYLFNSATGARVNGPASWSAQGV